MGPPAHVDPGDPTGIGGQTGWLGPVPAPQYPWPRPPRQPLPRLVLPPGVPVSAAPTSWRRELAGWLLDAPVIVTGQLLLVAVTTTMLATHPGWVPVLIVAVVWAAWVALVCRRPADPSAGRPADREAHTRAGGRAGRSRRARCLATAWWDLLWVPVLRLTAWTGPVGGLLTLGVVASFIAAIALDLTACLHAHPYPALPTAVPPAPHAGAQAGPWSLLALHVLAAWDTLIRPALTRPLLGYSYIPPRRGRRAPGTPSDH